jgi:hypothetical protein
MCVCVCVCSFVTCQDTLLFHDKRHDDPRDEHRKVHNLVCHHLREH